MSSNQKKAKRPRFFGSIRARLAAVVACFALPLVATVAILIWMEVDAIYAARQDQLKAVIQVAYKVIEREYEDYRSGKITEAEAQERAKSAVRAMRYNGDDYFFVQDSNLLTLVYGVRPDQEGLDGSRQAGKALERIKAQVTEINDVVGRIAAGAKDQATGLDVVNVAINQMDRVTQQNAAMVEESTAASHSLSQQTSQLSGLVGQFQVGRGGREARRASAASRTSLRAWTQQSLWRARNDKTGALP